MIPAHWRGGECRDMADLIAVESDTRHHRQCSPDFGIVLKSDDGAFYRLVLLGQHSLGHSPYTVASGQPRAVLRGISRPSQSGAGERVPACIRQGRVDCRCGVQGYRGAHQPQKKQCSLKHNFVERLLNCYRTVAKRYKSGRSVNVLMSYMGMSFRAADLNQPLLLPRSLHDWPPEKHLARFLVEVVETMNPDAIYASY